MSQAPSLPQAHASSASPFRAHDGRFTAVLGEAPRLVEVVRTDAHEGPVYVSEEDALYFTTVPRSGARGPAFPHVSIKRVALEGDDFPVDPDVVSVVREDAGAANGMALDTERRLLVCEQGSPSGGARISSVELSSGAAETVVGRVDGLPFNSPNDVVARSDGTVWFTDPSYGHLQGFRPKPQVADRVYRYDPRSDRVTVAADSFDKPNGVAFSPDESILYVGDSGANQTPGSYHPERPHHIKAFKVAEGGELLDECVFATTVPGFPDGIEVDDQGRVYASAFSGVQVFDPSGDLVGEIELPGAVNFTFGGPGRNVLFITADVAIWAAVLGATGPPPSRAGKQARGVSDP